MEDISQEEAVNSLPNLLDRIVKENLRCKIHTDEGSVVLLPGELYDNLLVTLEFLSTPGLLDRFQTLPPLDEALLLQE